MKYKLPLLISTTLMLSACASISEKFNDGMAYLFDEPATATEPSREYVGPDDANQQMRANAQARQVRQEEQSVNAFIPKDDAQQARVQDDSLQNVPGYETSIANKEAANQADRDGREVNETKYPEQAGNQINEQKKRESKPATDRRDPSDSASENDGAHYVHRGYQDPLGNGFYPRQTHKRVVDYASQLAMELMERAMGLGADELVGVTSFVRLNTSLTDTTILGNQLAEYLIAELQSYGVGVIDFKVTDGIKVTPHGDIAMSRGGERMAQSVQMDHILTGTMVEGPRGVRINARIVTVASKRVVASASIHIPAFVVTALYAGQAIAP